VRFNGLGILLGVSYHRLKFTGGRFAVASKDGTSARHWRRRNHQQQREMVLALPRMPNTASRALRHWHNFLNRQTTARRSPSDVVDTANSNPLELLAPCSETAEHSRRLPLAALPMPSAIA
jgi:hypothetical protein